MTSQGRSVERGLIFLLVAMTWLVFAGAASAQNVGSVFGPTVDPEDRSAEWRVGIDPDSDAINTRVHYQHSLNDSVRLRGIAQWADRAGGDLDFTFVQAELLWQFKEDTGDGFASGFRFDGRLNENSGRANQFGFNWTNQWSLTNGWRARALLLLDHDFGDDARDGLFVGARSNLTRRLDNGLRIGVEHFSDFGNTDAGFGGFDDQEHSLGPVVSGSFTERVSWYAGVQFGVSEGANDQDWQFRIGRSF